MLKNRNGNIISRFFKATAAFWIAAVDCQLFVILTAVALLAILPLFKTGLNDTANIIFNIIIFCTAAIAGFLAFKLKGSQMAAFTFAAALVFRLCLVLVLENSTPFIRDDVRTKTAPWIRHYDTALFQADEFFYVYQGQRYSDVTISEFMNLPEFTDNAYRAGFLMSKILKFFGDEFIWPRIVGAFLGAFAAAFVCLTAQEFFSKENSAIVSLLCVIAPQTAFYSVRFLKEIWIIFAASMMVFGFMLIIRNKKPVAAVLSITAAAITLGWFRFEYGLMFLAALPVAICFRRKSSPVGKIIAITLMILLGVIIFSYQFNQLTRKAGNLFDRYTLTERGQRGKLEAIEVMDKIYKSHGPLRLLNVPLSLLNPPPKDLHHIYSEENKLYDIVLLANIYQWWIPLPFLITGAIVIIVKRAEFLAFLLPYLVATGTSALLLGGLQSNLLRYRDSLAPIAFLVIGVGIDSFLTIPKSWKNKVVIAVYAVFVICAVFVLPVVYFYTRNF